MQRQVCRLRVCHPLRNMCACAIGQAHNQEALALVLSATDHPQRQSRPRVISVVNSNFFRSLILSSMSLPRCARSSPHSASPPRHPKRPPRAAHRPGGRRSNECSKGLSPLCPCPRVRLRSTPGLVAHPALTLEPFDQACRCRVALRTTSALAKPPSHRFPGAGALPGPRRDRFGEPRGTIPAQSPPRIEPSRTP